MADKDTLFEFQDFLSDKLPSPNYLTAQIGANIKLAREEMHLTQSELAQRVNRSQVTISDLENGKLEPSIFLLLRMCYVLVKPLSFFIPNELKRPFVLEAETPEEQEILQVMHYIFLDQNQDLAVKLVKLVQSHDEIDRDMFENPEKYIKED